MNHLTVTEAVENFPVIEEEGAAPTVPPRTTSTRQRAPSHSFTTITSDEIIPALSVEENSEEEPLIKQKLVPAPPVRIIISLLRMRLIKMFEQDGGYGWVIVFAAFLSNFVLDGISVSQSALMEDIRKASGVINESCIPPSNCTSTGHNILYYILYL